ncbi:MAG: DUF1549 and DUF1553 domain-containing protein [Akkermansiaceae bacterium]|jgi:hypothetical protein|nr:DUF1549 and DUF1553 domain-containing protein [Akkermansiaceae bacterium]
MKATALIQRFTVRMSFRTSILALAIGIAPCFEALAHWAYESPRALQPAENPEHPVDFHLAAAWQDAGLRPAELAAPRRWLERAAHLLTGLPPSADQIRRLEASPDDVTWRAVIDELLANPAYGERWARHWMDVARYADTQGYNFDRDNRYPFAYTYRDWLIRAFNDDLPYERFVQLQIAADHLVDRPDHPDLAALGLITVGPRSGGPETIDDRVDVITRGFLSSTVSCARCHDHKTDPITMGDYYSIYSILENAVEPGELPVIGSAADASAHQAYLAEIAALQEKDRAARQEIIDHLKSPETLATYLELAWLAMEQSWDAPKTTAESFSRGRFRPQAVLRWRDFLRHHRAPERANPRIARWLAALATADAPTTRQLCLDFAKDWTASPPHPELAALVAEPACPLHLSADRAHEIMDVEDQQAHALRRSEMSRVQAEHPGSPPRAMSLHDRKPLLPARTYHRGDPAAPGPEFERHWLGFLGGGTFPADAPPRLALARKITDPANPLTARVLVNRVWAWHFGSPLADPGDFGPQESAPVLLPLLDELAVRFSRSGGSLKELHRLLLTSRAFRLDTQGPAENDGIDQANTRFWKWQRRRLDFEIMRDRLLFSSGSLSTNSIGGRSVNLDDPNADTRRSVYAFIDRFALPTTFVSFDLPHPDHHAPRRAETTVPQQALWYLNGPLILRQAEKLAAHPELAALTDARQRLEWIYQRIHRRSPTARETAASLDWLAKVNPADYQPRLSGHWRVLQLRDDASPLTSARPFPLHADGVWKTGPNLDSAPIRWFHAGPKGGHPAAGHALVLRWEALGAGQIRLAGGLKRTQKGGAALHWSLHSEAFPKLPEGKLPPGGSTAVESPWIDVQPGQSVDFVLRAPEGDAFASFDWDFRIDGRETPTSAIAEISRLADAFPHSDSPPALPPAADPWADLIQVLWASNEFQFLD